MKHYQKAMAILIAVVLCALCALPACAEAPEYKSSEEMGGATVGLLTGMPFESMITEKIPDIGGFAYFASMPDETLALKAHKIDAIFINNALIDFAAAHNPELVKMSEHYLDSSFGFAFPKGDPQRDVWGGDHRPDEGGRHHRRPVGEVDAQRRFRQKRAPAGLAGQRRNGARRLRGCV